MKNTDERDQHPEAPRNRLSQLSEASLRINESLDLGTVLQEILDSARLLTGARCGVIVSVDEGQTGGDPRPVVEKGMGLDQLWRCAGDPPRRQESPPQAGRRREQPHLCLYRVSRRLPDAEGTGTRIGD